MIDKDYTEFIGQVRDCALCAEFLPEGPRPVFQCHPDARILVAGQAPGIRVHRSGVPFDDPSGDRLRDWMGVTKDIFYDPQRVAIIPMGFCYPGTGKSGDFPPRKECAEQWRERMLSFLPNIQTTLVIGQFALDWHLKAAKKRNLTETVRMWEEYWPDVLPLPHPSPRNNIWLKKNAWFEVEVLPALKHRVAECL